MTSTCSANTAPFPYRERGRGAVPRRSEDPAMADIANDALGSLAPEATPAAHDDAAPAALLEFMVTQWAPKAGLPELLEGSEHFRARRAALSAHFPADVLIVPTGHEKVRANDTTYRFRPGSDFYYLTGNVEADGVLV